MRKLFPLISVISILASVSAFAENKPGTCTISTRAALDSKNTGAKVLATVISEWEIPCPASGGEQLVKSVEFLPSNSDSSLRRQERTGDQEMVSILLKNLEKNQRTLSVIINPNSGPAKNQRLAVETRAAAYSTSSATLSMTIPLDDVDFESDQNNVFGVIYSFAVKAP
jgi:hypothetical protein